MVIGYLGESHFNIIILYNQYFKIFVYMFYITVTIIGGYWGLFGFNILKAPPPPQMIEHLTEHHFLFCK